MKSFFKSTRNKAAKEKKRIKFAWWSRAFKNASKINNVCRPANHVVLPPSIHWFNHSRFFLLGQIVNRPSNSPSALYLHVPCLATPWWT
jgi:hypothetical protein